MEPKGINPERKAEILRVLGLLMPPEKLINWEKLPESKKEAPKTESGKRKMQK